MRAMCILSLFFLFAFPACQADASPDSPLPEPAAEQKRQASPSLDAKVRPAPDAVPAEDGWQRMEDRIDRLEKITRGQIHADAYADDAMQLDREADKYIDMLKFAFIGLAGLSLVLAIGGGIVTFFKTRAPKKNIETHKKELNSILEEFNKNENTLQKKLSDTVLSEHFPIQIIRYAKQAVENGTGVEVLWGNAILSQNQQQWQDALMYWKNILEIPKEDSENKYALFGAALSAIKLSETAQAQEKEKYYSDAEKYLNRLSKIPPLENSVLIRWANMCMERGINAYSNRWRKQWFDEAEKKYKQVERINLEDAQNWRNWGTLCRIRAQDEYDPRRKTAGNSESGSRKPKHWAEEAEKKYKKATDKNPSDAQAWCDWGVLHMRRAERFTTENPRDAERTFRYSPNQKEFKAAEENFTLATEKNPEHAASWRNLGILCMNRAYYAQNFDDKKSWMEAEQAEKKFKRARDIDPDDFELWYNWGHLCRLRAEHAGCNPKQQKDWWEQADAKYEEAADINPEDFNIWYNWARLCEKLWECAKRGSAERAYWFGQAEAKYRQATDRHPEEITRWLAWGDLHVSRGDTESAWAEQKKWFDLAMEKYNQSIKMDREKSAQTALRLAERVFAKRWHDKVPGSEEHVYWLEQAMATYRNTEKDYPEIFHETEDALRPWGYLFLEFGSYARPGSAEQKDWFEQAEKNFRKLHDSDAQADLGRLYWRRWQYATDQDERDRYFEQAEKAFELATARPPATAEEAFELAPGEPEDELLRRASIQSEWGAMCTERAMTAGRGSKERALYLEKAERLYTRAMDLAPCNDDIWLNRGNLCLVRAQDAEPGSEERARHFEEAEKWYKQVTNQPPWYASAWYAAAWFGLARLAALRGQAGPCAEYLEKCHERSPRMSAAELDDEAFDPVRDSSGFTAFREKLRTR